MAIFNARLGAQGARLSRFALGRFNPLAQPTDASSSSASRTFRADRGGRAAVDAGVLAVVARRADIACADSSVGAKCDARGLDAAVEGSQHGSYDAAGVVAVADERVTSYTDGARTLSPVGQYQEQPLAASERQSQVDFDG